MKKITAILLACTALLASCHHGRMEADAPGDAILFSAGGAGMRLDVKSGSTQADPSDFMDSENFFLYGTWTLPDGNSAEIFRKQEVSGTYNSVSGYYDCTYDPIRKWQKGGTYDFRGIYPASEADIQSSTTGKAVVVSYSMHTDDYDLMVAYAGRDIAGGDESPVHLEFHHATAAVRFLFQKGSGVSTVYKLNDFKLQYVKTVGSFIWTARDPEADNLGSCWFTADYRPSSVLEWTASPAKDVPQSYDDYSYDWYYVIPQSLRADYGDPRPAITFGVLVNDIPTPVYTTLELPDTYTDAGGNTQAASWEAGKLYTYYVQIQPSEVDITVKVTPWEEYKVAVDDILF